MCDEFYLTLVSNNITDPNNTIASFNTYLPRFMEFDPGWRVGLSDISFTKSWFNLKENATITLTDENMLVYDTHDVVKAGFYASEMELSSAIGKVLESASLKIEVKKNPSVEIDTVSRRVTVVSGITTTGMQLKPLLDVQLSNMLGLEVHEYDGFSIKGGWKSVRAYDLNAGVHCIFAYCDLIAPVFVGDSFSQVIRTVAIPEIPFGQESCVHYNPIQYHKLNKHYIDRIEVQLCDDSGELIPFEFGRSKLTLHFKRNG